MPVTAHFIDRNDAGRRLAAALRAYEDDRPLIVLGLPRGGVPVAARVAEDLNAPLDVCIVRKLGVPGHEELALGAIASGGAVVFNHDIVGSLGVAPEDINEVIAREMRELHRREAWFRGERRFPVLTGMTVILVDDGSATGASMRAAVETLRPLKPRKIVAALPVASRAAVSMLREIADDCVCVIEPEPFYAVGVWYADFEQTSDAEVRLLLANAWRRWVSPPLPTAR